MRVFKKSKKTSSPSRYRPPDPGISTGADIVGGVVFMLTTIAFPSVPRGPTLSLSGHSTPSITQALAPYPATSTYPCPATKTEAIITIEPGRGLAFAVFLVIACAGSIGLLAYRIRRATDGSKDDDDGKGSQFGLTRGHTNSEGPLGDNDDDDSLGHEDQDEDTDDDIDDSGGGDEPDPGGSASQVEGDNVPVGDALKITTGANNPEDPPPPPTSLLEDDDPDDDISDPPSFLSDLDVFLAIVVAFVNRLQNHQRVAELIKNVRSGFTDQASESRYSHFIENAEVSESTGSGDLTSRSDGEVVKVEAEGGNDAVEDLVIEGTPDTVERADIDAVEDLVVERVLGTVDIDAVEDLVVEGTLGTVGIDAVEDLVIKGVLGAAEGANIDAIVLVVEEVLGTVDIDDVEDLVEGTLETVSAGVVEDLMIEGVLETVDFDTILGCMIEGLLGIVCVADVYEIIDALEDIEAEDSTDNSNTIADAETVDTIEDMETSEIINVTDTELEVVDTILIKSADTDIIPPTSPTIPTRTSADNQITIDLSRRAHEEAAMIQEQSPGDNEDECNVKFDKKSKVKGSLNITEVYSRNFRKFYLKNFRCGDVDWWDNVDDGQYESVDGKTWRLKPSVSNGSSASLSTSSILVSEASSPAPSDLTSASLPTAGVSPPARLSGPVQTVTVGVEPSRCDFRAAPESEEALRVDAMKGRDERNREMDNKIVGSIGTVQEKISELLEKMKEKMQIDANALHVASEAPHPRAKRVRPDASLKRRQRRERLRQQIEAEQGAQWTIVSACTTISA